MSKKTTQKDVSREIGIPERTLRDWRVGTGYRKLLYVFLKSRTIEELKEIAKAGNEQ